MFFLQNPCRYDFLTRQIRGFAWSYYHPKKHGDPERALYDTLDMSIVIRELRLDGIVATISNDFGRNVEQCPQAAIMGLLLGGEMASLSLIPFGNEVDFSKL